MTAVSHRSGNGYFSSLSSLNKNAWLWLFAWFGAVGFSSFGIFIVVYNLYVQRLGFGPRDVGMLLSLQTVMMAICSLPAGLLGARYGTKRLMMVGLGILITSYLITLAVPWVPGPYRQAALAVGVIIMGGGLAVLITSSVPLFTSFTGPGNRVIAFSLMSAMEPLGGFAGSIVGGLFPGLVASLTGSSLDETMPYRVTMLLPVIMMAGAMAAIAGTTRGFDEGEGTHALGDSEKRRRGLPSAASVALIAVLCLVSATRMQPTFFPRLFFNLYVDSELGVDIAGIGSAMGLAQLAMLPIVMAMPLLYTVMSKEKAFVFGVMITVGGAVLLSAVPRFAAATLAIVITNLGFGVSNTVFNQYSQEIVKPSLRPPVIGLLILTQSAGIAAMNLVGGYLIPVVGFRNVFLIAGLVGIVAAFAFGVYFRKPRGEYKRVVS